MRFYQKISKNKDWNKLHSLITLCKYIACLIERYNILKIIGLFVNLLT